MNRVLFWIFLLTFVSNSVGKEPRIYSTQVAKDPVESYETLLIERIGLPKELVYKKNYLNKNYEWNKKFQHFKTSSNNVYVQVPYEYKDLVLRYKLSELSQQASDRILVYTNTDEGKQSVGTINRDPDNIQSMSIAEVKKQNYYDNIRPSQDFSLVGFYAASNGSFSETLKSQGITATSTQDSGITLGLMAKIKQNKNLNLSTSFYFSRLDGGVASNSDKVDIPLEYGSNVYWEYRYKKDYFYSGLDFERFSTFNIDELNNGEDLATRENNIVYATVGYTSTFNLKNRLFIYKGSLSQSIFSQSNSSDGNYSGNKLMLFTTTKLYKEFYVNAFYKHHILSGLSDLSISRYGFGIAYKLF